MTTPLIFIYLLHNAPRALDRSSDQIIRLAYSHTTSAKTIRAPADPAGSTFLVECLPDESRFSFFYCLQRHGKKYTVSTSLLLAAIVSHLIQAALFIHKLVWKSLYKGAHPESTLPPGSFTSLQLILFLVDPDIICTSISSKKSHDALYVRECDGDLRSLHCSEVLYCTHKL